MVTQVALKETVSRRQDMGQEPSTLFKAKPRCQWLAEARLAQAAGSVPRAPCLPPFPSSWFQTLNGEQFDSLPGTARQCSGASALSPEHLVLLPHSPPRRWGVGWGAGFSD